MAFYVFQKNASIELSEGNAVVFASDYRLM
jgi:hypothetical protein